MQVEVDVDLVEHLSDLLSSGDMASAKALMNDVNFEQLLEGRANDVIPVASYYITKEVQRENAPVFRCAGKVLKMCASKGYPKECLMEFLAQIESLDEVKFETLLYPVQSVLLRIPEKKAPLMLCVFNVIYSFINSLEVPVYLHVDSKSKLLMDCDEKFQKIRSFYNMLVGFYQPLVVEVTEESQKDKRVKNIKLALIQALLQLLGNPLVSLDLEDYEKAPSGTRVICSEIVNMLVKLQYDPLQFLSLVEENELLTTEEERSVVSEFSSNEIKFSDLSMSVFFYLIFCEKMCQKLPLVYDHQYIFKNCLTLAVTLLRHKESLILRKGLLLVREMVQKLEPGSASFSQLTCGAHKNIMEQLSNIAIFDEVEENRKLAAELIKQHFLSFKPKAQFYILINSSTESLHPNVMGFLTTMLSSLLRETFKNDALKEFFTGKRLFDLLKAFCFLKKGAETDLMENKDQIISSLNLTYFLLKRDDENVTGVWDYVSELLLSFLTPLREAIKLSRAHYQLQMTSLDESPSAGDGPEFAVSIGGQQLDLMSTAEKKSVLSSSLTVFDLMEHLLSRAEECVEQNPWLISND